MPRDGGRDSARARCRLWFCLCGCSPGEGSWLDAARPFWQTAKRVDVVGDVGFGDTPCSGDEVVIGGVDGRVDRCSISVPGGGGAAEVFEVNYKNIKNS